MAFLLLGLNGDDWGYFFFHVWKISMGIWLGIWLGMGQWSNLPNIFFHVLKHFNFGNIIGGDYECSSSQHRGFWYLLIGFDTSPNVSWKDRHSNHRHKTGDFWYSSNSVNPNNGKLDIQVWSIPNCQFIAQISSSYWVPVFLSVFASHQSRVSHFRSEEEFKLFLNSDFTLSCGFFESESQGAPDEAHSCAAWTSDVSEPTTWGVSCTSTQALTRNTWTHALCTRETAGSVTELRRGPLEKMMKPLAIVSYQSYRIPIT